MGAAVNVIGKNSNKNFVINGGCIVAQRGSVAAANNVFKYGGCDRFTVGPFLSSVSAGNIVQQPLAGAASGLAQCLQGLTSTGAGTVQFYTRLEGSIVKKLNGKKITVSVLVYQNTGLTLTANIQLAKATALDNFAGLTTLTNPSFSVPSGVETRLSFTYTLGASDATNGLEIRPFFTLAGAVTGKDFYVGDWCLEEGSAFTGMDKRDYPAELALCQRYFCVINNFHGTGWARSSASDFYISGFQFPVTMRTTPIATPNLTTSYILHVPNQISVNPSSVTLSPLNADTWFAQGSYGAIPAGVWVCEFSGGPNKFDAEL